MTTPRRAVRRLTRTVGDLALWVLAACGVLCTVLAVLGVTAGFGVVLFRTGSMSPTIPAGSAALVREIPADQVEVGDVVTVDRVGLPPVTHRVVDVAPATTGDPDARDLTLRGDANTADDPEPYPVTEVRRVVVAVPGVARVVAALGEPRFLVPISLAASTLITVLLWPRRRAVVQVGGGAGAGSGAGVGAGAGTEAGTDDAPPVEVPAVGSSAATGPRTASAVTLVLLAAGLLGTQPGPAAAGTTITATSAATAATTAVTTSLGVDGPLLVLGSEVTPASRLLAPGTERDWVLTLSATGLDSGTIDRELVLTGPAEPALTVQVDRCGSYSGATDCVDPVRVAGPRSPDDGTTVIGLPTQDALTTERLRIRVALAADAADEVQGLRSSMELTAVAEGVATTVVPPEDEPGTTDDGTGGTEGIEGTGAGTGAETVAGGSGTSRLLAVTGARLWPPLLLGLALLITGTAHLVARRTGRTR